MLNIVVIGAGKVGRHIASVLSKEQHNVILIDSNPKKIQEASQAYDVATKVGSGTDWQLLDDLLEMKPSLLVALTASDETNLACCTIAKHLGYPKVICRLSNDKFLNTTRLDFARIFEVDYFICPEILAANEILKQTIYSKSIFSDSFAHGAVQVRTILIPANSKKDNRPISELNIPGDLIIALIKRVKNGVEEIIFPHGSDYFLAGDEATIIGKQEAINEAYVFFGIQQEKTESVTIMGGSKTGINLAKLLIEHHISVRLIEKDYQKCLNFADQLPNCTVINHDGTDLNFLKTEKIDQSGLFVACTKHDDLNILSSLLAKEVGCKDLMVMLNNTNYTHLAESLKINHTISPATITANHILSQILTGTVTSLVTLYENQAEIIELYVPMDSKLAGIPLSEIGPFLPKDFLIAIIQNRGRVMVANGSRVISPGDTVIIVTNPKHASEIERLF